MLSVYICDIINALVRFERGILCFSAHVEDLLVAAYLYRIA